MAEHDSAAENKELMERVIRSYAEGDLRPLFEAVDENVIWITSSPGTDFLPFGGTYFRSVGVSLASAEVFSTYQFQQFEPVEIVTQGDVVWGLFRIEALHHPSGNIVHADYAMRWCVRFGRIVHHQGFLDTAALLLQQGEVPDEPPPLSPDAAPLAR